MTEIEKDPVSGRETTGHEWDGIKELNTPLPRWWLYTFYVCIIWAVGYWVVYPAWPTLSGYTKGVIGYSSRAELAKELAARDESRIVWTEKFDALSVEEISKVTVPTFLLGNKPLGPKIFATFPTNLIKSGVATATSKSVHPFFIFVW